MYSKFSFGEVYRRICGRKFNFTATHDRQNIVLQQWKGYTKTSGSLAATKFDYIVSL